MAIKSAPLPEYKKRPADAPLPLDGIKVLDFTHFLAGPFATLILGDFGAEIVKVESAGGDGFRNFPPHIDGESVAYQWVNRNKASVALDLKQDEGRAIARALARDADILIENFSTGVMERLGLSYRELSAENPRLIYCSVSAYGREGPFSKRVGFDSIAQAESGFFSMNGLPDGDPMRAGPSIMDIATAMMAANAIQAALLARHRTGKGQQIEVTLLGMAVNMLGNFHATYLATGVSPTRAGNTQVTASPIGYFHTQDKPIYITCANDRIFQRMMSEAMGRPDITADPDFATNVLRIKHFDRLYALMADILRHDTRDNWLQKMHAAGVAASAVRTVGEAMEAPEIRNLGMLSAIEHPKLGPIPNVALPVRFSDTPVADPVPTSALGEDTDRILAGLGYSPERIRQLAQAGVLGEKRRKAASE